MSRTPVWKFFTLFLLGLCWPAAVFAATADSASLPEPVTAALKRHGFPARGLSLYVHEIGQGEPLLAVAADAPRHPAEGKRSPRTV